MAFYEYSDQEDEAPLAKAAVYEQGSRVIAKRWNDNLGRWQRIAQGKAGVDDARVAQSALDSLTPNRTWKETVLLFSQLVLNEQIQVDDYTKIVGGEIINTVDGGILLNGSNIELSNIYIHSDNNVRDVCCWTNKDVENIYIHDCVFESGYQPVVISNIGNYIIKNVMISNSSILKAGVIGQYGVGIVIGKGAENVVVDRCTIRQCGITNIDVWGCNKYVEIRSTNIIGNGNKMGIAITSIRDNINDIGDTSGIVINKCDISGQFTFDAVTCYGDAKYIYIGGNNIHDIKCRSAIRIHYNTVDGVNYFSHRHIVMENNLFNVDGEGITLIGDKTENTSGVIVANNILENISSFGIKINARNRVLVIGNKLYYVNTNADNLDDGYSSAIPLINCEYCVIAYNHLIDNGNLNYGVHERSDAWQPDFSRIFCNQLIGFKNAGCLIVGEHTIAYQNDGYITENYGTATITSDGTTTTFNIPHGLVSTPSFVMVTPKAGAPEPSSIDWDDTNIILTFATAPAAGTYYYAWEAKV